MSRYSDQVLADGAVAYWRLGEASGLVADDSGPNNLDGVIAATGITYGVQGALLGDANTALTFDGTSNPITVVDNNALDLGDGPFTIELWFKRSATQGATQTLLTKGTNAYELRFSTANILRAIKVGGVEWVNSSAAITDQNWHHAVVTKNGSARALYLDGVDVSSLPADQTLANNTSLLRIGSAAGASRFPGSKDEPVLYNVVLTPTQVLEHYNLGKSWFGAAALDGDSVLAGTGVAAKFASSALSGESDLTSAALRALLGSTALSGDSDLTALASRTLFASAVLSGDGELVAAAARALFASSTLSGESDLTAAATRALFAAAALSGDGEFAANGIRTLLASAALGGESEMVAVALRALVGSAILSGESDLVASALKFAFASAALSGESNLTATGVRAVLAAALLSSDGSLTASAVRALLGEANLSGQSDLTANALRLALGAAVLSGDSTLIASALKWSLASAVLAGEGIFTASGRRISTAHASHFAKRSLGPPELSDSDISPEPGFGSPFIGRASIG